MITPDGFRVRAGRCDHRADERTIDAALRRLTAPLERAWSRLAAARTIAVKVNLVWPPDKVRRHEGRHQELVDPEVFRCVLRLLRERTTARVVVTDTTLLFGDERGRDVTFRPLLEELEIDYIECNDPPSASFDVPGGGLMFDRYLLHPIFREVDEMVSVATLKNHNFMGVTLTTKNLFGLPPVHPGNRNRTYYHHIIRLPFVLADLARLLDPALCIVDGLVGQARREWGGEARVADTLIAGDHPIATDLCGAWLMGHDPYGDWPTPPYRRDRSHLRVAVDAGWGPASLEAIDFDPGDVQSPVAEFDSDQVDSPATVASWRRTMCEQALDFAARRAEFEARFAGEYIYYQDGEVLWHAPHPPGWVSRRDLAGVKKDRAIWLKYVDPTDWEGEHFEVYERELARMSEPVGA